MVIRAIFQGALIATATGALLLAGCSGRSDAPYRAAGQPRASAAQRIVLDPALHTVAESALKAGAALAADLPASDLAGRRRLPAAAEELRLPDGTVGMRVAQQYLHTIVICRQPGGGFSTQCPAASPGAERASAPPESRP